MLEAKTFISNKGCGVYIKEKGNKPVIIYDNKKTEFISVNAAMHYIGEVICAHRKLSSS